MSKLELRSRATALRRAGWTYPQIARELGSSKSTCSAWLRDVAQPLTPGEAQARRTAAVRAAAARTQAARQSEREVFAAEVRRAFGQPSDRDLLVALAVSYWCEGGKSKPWARRERVQWMNGDPLLVRLFLEGLRLLGVPDERVRLRVAIHETADELAARRWWATQLGWPLESFMRSTIKRHAAKTIRKNVDTDYHGCLSVTVLQSRLLYQLLDALVQGLAAGCATSDAGGSMERAAGAT